MRVVVGTRLAHYEVSDLLGAGGMGEVYRATDKKLKREVALKILPEVFAGDPSLLARFEREAQVLALLNHPNIASIYGLESSANTHFLVLELIQGPTLADRIAQGPIPLSETLRIASQIAAALETAHEKGVIHRDLKPSNVKLTMDGTVKVLDFGLAKTLSVSNDPLNSATATIDNTKAGVVMGTPSYMSPEQAQGQPVDKRTDVWSFGVVLYEMLSGRKAFEGKSVSHTLVQLLEQDPDWSRLSPLPADLRGLLKRCLEKDPARRLRDIGDVRILLEPAMEQQDGAAVKNLLPAKTGRIFAWGAAGLGAAGLCGMFFLWNRTEKPVPAVTTRLEILQPKDAKYTSFMSVSPDGRRLAFVAVGANGHTRLWVRSLESGEARALDGTDDANGSPFWSTDSRTIAFSTEPGYKLKRVTAAGGPPQTICDLTNRVRGGFWTSDDRIVYGEDRPNSGLHQVNATKGVSTTLTRSDSGSDVWPDLLPDGRHFLFTHSASPEAAANGIFLGSLDAKPGETFPRLLPDASQARFVPSPAGLGGFVLFVRNPTSGLVGTLMAQGFDTGKFQLVGDAVPIAEQVAGIAFTASDNGVLVYHTGPPFQPNSGGPGYMGQLTWFDRKGNVVGTEGKPEGFVLGNRISPGLPGVCLGHGPGNLDIYVGELGQNGRSSRLTSDTGLDTAPVWSPDSSEIIFSSARVAGHGLYRRSANSGGADQLLYLPPASDGDAYPADWSHDGRFLFFTTIAPGRPQGDIWVLSLAGDRKAVPLIHTEFSERGGSITRDSQWIAYTSNDKGRDDAYVRRFDPATMSSVGDQFLVSKDGGTIPLWRENQKELFYLAPDGTMMSVEVSTVSGFHARDPQALFKAPPGAFYDVTPDGQKFLIPVPQSLTTTYNVVLNWMSDLKH